MAEPTTIGEAEARGEHHPPAPALTAPATVTPAPTAKAHVGGLDSVRLVCALVVVFGHIGFVPLFSDPHHRNLAVRLLAAAYGNAMCGPAAVIVFFVVSGFCIHYPYRDGAPIPYVAYYARRYLRILVPMAMAIALGASVGVKLTLLSDSILWSLVAEEIYYLLYPLLRQLGSRFGFPRLIAVAYGLSLLVAASDPHAGNYASYGAALNWLLGLPVWLLGCDLAERVSRPQPVPSRRAIWTWRCGLWGVAALASALRFHTPIKYPFTLNLFGMLAGAWLLREISYRSVRPAPRLLERGGRWSYSIYLVHLQGAALFALLGLPVLDPYSGWLLKACFTLLVCYAFARLIEFPAHRLARLAGTRLLATAGQRAAE